MAAPEEKEAPLNGRLTLGMKGAMSEMKLSLFRQRSLEALKQKARRGELCDAPPVGSSATAARLPPTADRPTKIPPP